MTQWRVERSPQKIYKKSVTWTLKKCTLRKLSRVFHGQASATFQLRYGHRKTNTRERKSAQISPVVTRRNQTFPIFQLLCDSLINGYTEYRGGMFLRNSGITKSQPTLKPNKKIFQKKISILPMVWRSSKMLSAF